MSKFTNIILGTCTFIIPKTVFLEQDKTPKRVSKAFFSLIFLFLCDHAEFISPEPIKLGMLNFTPEIFR